MSFSDVTLPQRSVQTGIYEAGGRALVDPGLAYGRLALGVLGVLAGPLEGLDELCGEVGVVQLQGRQAFSQEDRGLASVCGVCHDHDAGHLTLLPWVQFAVPRRSAQVADVAAVTCP